MGSVFAVEVEWPKDVAATVVQAILSLVFSL